MSARERLQKLIDALERRRDSLSDESTSFTLDMSDCIQQLAGGGLPTCQVATALDELVVITNDLRAALGHEAAALRVIPALRRNATRPAVSLPGELLGAIFVYASAYSSLLSGPPASLSEPRRCNILREVRRSIAATCRRWRQVALATTSLWSNISVELTTTSRPPMYCDEDEDENWSESGSSVEPVRVIPPLSLLSLEFERAHSRPLNLQIHVSGISDLWKEYRDLIRTVLPRCRTIRIYAGVGTRLNTVLHAEHPVSFPHLVSVISTSQDDDEEREITLNVSLAPRLRILAVDGYTCTLSVAPATHLTKLYLGLCIDFDVALSILRRCSALQEFDWGCWDGVDVTTIDSLALLHLRRLTLRGRDVSSIHGMLVQALDAPELRYLHIDGYIAFPLATQFPSLRVLETLLDPEMFPLFLQFIRNTPSLVRLELLWYFELFPALETALSGVDIYGNWEVLPLLKRLVITGEWFGENVSDIARLVKTRHSDDSKTACGGFVVEVRGATAEELHHLAPWAIAGGKRSSEPVTFDPDEVLGSREEDENL